MGISDSLSIGRSSLPVRASHVHALSSFCMPSHLTPVSRKGLWPVFFPLHVAGFGISERLSTDDSCNEALLGSLALRPTEALNTCLISQRFPCETGRQLVSEQTNWTLWASHRVYVRFPYAAFCMTRSIIKFHLLLRLATLRLQTFCAFVVIHLCPDLFNLC